MITPLGVEGGAQLICVDEFDMGVDTICTTGPGAVKLKKKYSLNYEYMN